MRVLIVQGQPELATLWGRHIGRLGAAVDVAVSQEEAVAAINSDQIDVILLSMDLSAGSAMAVADYASYRRPAARVIFVSNSGFFSDGSVFAHFSNVCAMMPEDTPPEDLTAMVEHFADH